MNVICRTSKKEFIGRTLSDGIIGCWFTYETSVPMRNPMSLVPHTIFPAVKAVQLSSDGKVIKGRYDFSKLYDPFDNYLHKYEEGPLMDLIKAEESANGALIFTRRWGPLDFDRFVSEDSFIHEQIYRLSHKRGWLPVIPKLPKEGFTVGVEGFLEDQRKVKGLLALWKAVREENLAKIRSLLEKW